LPNPHIGRVTSSSRFLLPFGTCSFLQEFSDFKRRMVCFMGTSLLEKQLKASITVCLRRAGEILPDKTAIDEESNDDKFGQLMRNKTVHLLALFLMVYIGVEVTIGGTVFVSYTIVTSLILLQDGL
jgi:hypothetical protein